MNRWITALSCVLFLVLPGCSDSDSGGSGQTLPDASFTAPDSAAVDVGVAPDVASPNDSGAEDGATAPIVDAGADDVNSDSAGDADSDAGIVDSGSDAGIVDSGSDAGIVDSGSDAGPVDAGSDAGPVDAGSDAGPADAGSDAGLADAGGGPAKFVASGCDLKVNTNGDGTVNPFISPAREGQFYVSYVAKGGNLMVGWEDPKVCKTAAGPFQVNKVAGEVYYWGGQSVVSDQAGNFYAVWEAKKPSGIAFAWSKSGKDFSTTALVSSTSENGIHPSLIAPKPGQVHVAWTGLHKGQYDPFYARTDNAFDAGGKWTMGQLVAASKVQDDSTAVAVGPGGAVFLAWETFEGDLFVARSDDSGKTWSAPAQVNDVAGKAHVGIGSFMVVDPSSGTVHVAWKDTRKDGEGDLWWDSSPDGKTFGTDVMVADSTKRYQEDPSLVVGGLGTPCAGVVYAVWQDFRSNKSYDIYGARLSPGTKVWSANQLLTPKSDGDQMNPAIAVDTGCTVGVAWRDSAANASFDIKATFFAW